MGSTANYNLGPVMFLLLFAIFCISEQFRWLWIFPSVIISHILPSLYKQRKYLIYNFLMISRYVESLWVSCSECFLTEVARKNDSIQVIGLNVISNCHILSFFSTDFAHPGSSSFSSPSCPPRDYIWVKISKCGKWGKN